MKQKQPPIRKLIFDSSGAKFTGAKERAEFGHLSKQGSPWKLEGRKRGLRADEFFQREGWQ